MLFIITLIVNVIAATSSTPMRRKLRDYRERTNPSASQNTARIPAPSDAANTASSTATPAGETYLKLTYCSSETSLGMGRGCCMLNGCIATTQFAGFWFVELDRIGRSGQWIVCGQYVCHHAGGRRPA